MVADAAGPVALEPIEPQVGEGVAGLKAQMEKWKIIVKSTNISIISTSVLF